MYFFYVHITLDKRYKGIRLRLNNYGHRFHLNINLQNETALTGNIGVGRGTATPPTKSNGILDKWQSLLIFVWTI